MVCHAYLPRMKTWVYLALMLGIPAQSAEKVIEYVCWRWAWAGEVYERKVVCLEWRRK